MEFQVTARPTPVISDIDGVLCREWVAVDAEGRRLVLFVHRVATRDVTLAEVLDQLLEEMPRPQGY